MYTIPLKSSTGTITLLDNGSIELKKIDTLSLFSKTSINRVNISSEGRIVIFQANTPYSVDHEFRVDKPYIPKIREMFTMYYDTGDEAPSPNSDILYEYKKSIRLIADQLVIVNKYNMEYGSETDARFILMQMKLDEVERVLNQRSKLPYAIMVALMLVMFAYNLYLAIQQCNMIMNDRNYNTTYVIIEPPVLFQETVFLEWF
jgi:hypothetical protein